MNQLLIAKLPTKYRFLNLNRWQGTVPSKGGFSFFFYALGDYATLARSTISTKKGWSKVNWLQEQEKGRHELYKRRSITSQRYPDMFRAGSC